MKYLSLVFFFLSSVFLIGQQSYTTEKGDQHLLGMIQISDLEKEPYQEWFKKDIDQNYEIESVDGLSDLKVKIFIGTWCGDTRRWLPEFMKFWNDNNLPQENLSLIALHNESAQYKKSPDGEEVGMNIHRVPTFIFYEGDKEVGRIVESPLNDLRTDIAQIGNGLPSNARYRGVSLLEEAMNNESIDSLYLKKNYRPLLQQVYREISKPSELNTYGYVLKAQGEIRKAEFVFYMNRNIFQWDPNTWDSLGETYFEQDKFADAKVNYEKVLALNPQSKNAAEMLEKLKDKVK
jgi:tetratricopeptide (TPR) repeat protein